MLGQACAQRNHPCRPADCSMGCPVSAPGGRSVSVCTSSAGPRQSAKTPDTPPGLPAPWETRKRSVSEGTVAAEGTDQRCCAADAEACAARPVGEGRRDF